MVCLKEVVVVACIDCRGLSATAMMALVIDMVCSLVFMHVFIVGRVHKRAFLRILAIKIVETWMRHFILPVVQIEPIYVVILGGISLIIHIILILLLLLEFFVALPCFTQFSRVQLL